MSTQSFGQYEITVNNNTDSASFPYKELKFQNYKFKIKGKLRFRTIIIEKCKYRGYAENNCKLQVTYGKLSSQFN